MKNQQYLHDVCGKGNVKKIREKHIPLPGKLLLNCYNHIVQPLSMFFQNMFVCVCIFRVVLYQKFHSNNILFYIQQNNIIKINGHNHKNDIKHIVSSRTQRDSVDDWKHDVFIQVYIRFSGRKFLTCVCCYTREKNIDIFI